MTAPGAPTAPYLTSFLTGGSSSYTGSSSTSSSNGGGGTVPWDNKEINVTPSTGNKYVPLLSEQPSKSKDNDTIYPAQSSSASSSPSFRKLFCKHCFFRCTTPCGITKLISILFTLSFIVEVCLAIVLTVYGGMDIHQSYCYAVLSTTNVPISVHSGILLPPYFLVC